VRAPPARAPLFLANVCFDSDFAKLNSNNNKIKREERRRRRFSRSDLAALVVVVVGAETGAQKLIRFACLAQLI
jgi:hypothetical protein